MAYDRVLKYCKKEGITICEFERRCGMSNGSIGKWRKHTPSVSSITKVVKYTGIPITYWLGGCV